MNDYITFDEFLNLHPDEQRRVFEKQQAEAAKKRKYGLYWDDSRHREDVVARCENEMPVLEEVEERRIRYAPPAADLFDTPDRPQPTHLLIEGDNYHALSVLNYTHRGKIDLIYIDPPYNTGNRDFRYNDNFVDREDGDRHTKWLSFMQRRLELAKHLLKDSGVIFISIDDNEVAQLKLLCDKVFGEGNFVANVIWQKKYSPQNDARYFSDNHDFILCYKKNDWKINPLQRTEEQISRYKNPDNDKRGPWKPSDFSVKSYSAAYDYPITLPSGRVVNPPASRCWVTSEKRFKEMVEDNRIWFGENGNNVPSMKKFLSEVKEGTTPLTIWPYDEVGHNQTAKQELKSVLNESQFTFDSPKPVKLIQKIINISINAAINPNAVILDFFAGSGTTGHAVLEMNREDGGRRQFILVTNNEVTDKTRRQLEAESKSPDDIEAVGICRAVTCPRLQRVVEGYTNPKGEKVAGTGGKLRYFRTDFVSAEGSSDQLCYNLRRRCTEMLCFRENVFDPLAAGEQWEIFRDHDRVLAILHDEHPRHRDALRDALRALEGVSECKLYVFTLDREVNAADYADFQNVVLENVPAKIIDLYKREVQRLSAVQAELAS